MKKNMAFVLSSGGSRGALQAGALRALQEAGYKPDLITASSIGAANGAFLAVHGYSAHSIQQLIHIWESTIDQDLLPTNLWWQTMRAFFTRSKGFSQQRIREFAISNGITPQIHFKDLKSVRFYPVAADLNTSLPVVMGLDPEESVLECILASMTLPPWLPPITQDGKYLIDGGAVSNLPIEAAIQQGAEEIIALDLLDHYSEKTAMKNALGNFFLKLDKAVENRHAQLEMELAKARGIPVWRISLVGENLVPFWDFRQSAEQIELGYKLAKKEIENWKVKERA